MKRMTTGSVAALCLTASVAVLAQPPGGGIARLDTDGDGLVSPVEFAERDARFGPKVFDKADTDGDGAVSMDELQATIDDRTEERHTRASERMQTLFEAMDGNEDGFVTREEIEAHAFARLDLDGDGYISASEAEEMHERRGDRRARWRDRDSAGA